MGGSRSTVNYEMLANHLRIIVPHLEIRDRCSLLCCKSECGCTLIDCNFIEDLEFDICDTLLSCKNTNDKTLDDIKGRLGVCMWLHTGLVDKTVAPEEKLRDIPTEIVSQIELASWMHFFISIQIKDEVVKNDQ